MAEWSAYYERHEARPPRDLLGFVVDAVRTATGPTRQATDLGFGQGTETVALLEQGWRVLAVDAEPDAARRLRSRLSAAVESRLDVVTASFADVLLPPCDLVWSALALPFCPPQDFQNVWQRIRAALLPGGVLAVDLFGPHHAWAATTTTVRRDEVDGMLDGLEVLTLDERDEPRPTVADGVQRWHGFTVVARRPLEPAS